MLTAKERKTLNDAIAIIQAHTPKGAMWMIHPAHHNTRPSCDVTYFDTAKRQHSGLWEDGCTFADKIEMGIARQAAIPSPEVVKAETIERLRKQLSELTGEAA